MINLIKNSKINVYFLLVFLILFIISTFRNGLGTDYYAYADLYQSPDGKSTDFLFNLFFIEIPRLFSKNEITFFLITSFVVNFFFLKKIFNTSVFIVISVFLYLTQFYFISFNAVRQFIAISLFFYYANLIIKKNSIVYYFIFIIILAQLHFSMYFFIIFPLLGNKFLENRRYWTVWIISIFILFAQINNLITISTLFNSISFLSFLSIRFDDLNNAAEFFYNGYGSNLQLYSLNILFLFFLIRQKKIINCNNVFWFNLFLFGLIVHNILVKFSLFAVRISYVGDVALIILIPLYIKSFKLKSNKILISTIFIIFYLTNFYIRFVLNGESDIFKEGIFLDK